MRSYATQAGFQVAGVCVSFAIAIVGGIITGKTLFALVLINQYFNELSVLGSLVGCFEGALGLNLGFTRNFFIHKKNIEIFGNFLIIGNGFLTLKISIFFLTLFLFFKAIFSRFLHSSLLSHRTTHQAVQQRC